MGDVLNVDIIQLVKIVISALMGTTELLHKVHSWFLRYVSQIKNETKIKLSAE